MKLKRFSILCALGLAMIFGITSITAASLTARHQPGQLSGRPDNKPSTSRFCQAPILLRR